MKYLGLALLLVSLSACSSFDMKPDENDKTVEAPLADPDSNEASVSLRPVTAENPNEVVDTKPLTDGIASPMVETPKTEEVDVTLNKKSYLDEKHHAPKTDTIPAEERKEVTYTGKADGVEPEKVLKWLKNGNTRFLKPALRADGQSRKDIKRLSQREKPHAVVFTYSDSRIPPEVIFDQKLGEIYVIRNSDLSVDNSVLNSIDNAVNELGTRLIVILDRNSQKGMDFSYVDQTAQKLADGSASLRAGLEAKNVMVVPALYDMASGKVTFGK